MLSITLSISEDSKRIGRAAGHVVRYLVYSGYLRLRRVSQILHGWASRSRVRGREFMLGVDERGIYSSLLRIDT